ncbi:DNA repair protein RecO [Sulfuriroseicoccus oceanibius]|uniref:DNA repair protein RecO n=1 Tax=Sulfuriroseicoccus oceanibius TaxID=2707525 RepID=A0A6B3L9U9_9BACT|nr:DNA repair protein RecO [Sulfuriroseicoccus oceanibius]QQL46042.1 DNA repair protein RecO [Sulfuriroseicoccus oceanibius]
MEKSIAHLLRLTPFSDTSVIVTWCTDNHGLIKTIAKGSRRPKSPFRGMLDHFFTCEIEWKRSLRSEIHTLTEAALHTPRLGIRKDYTTMLAAGYFCECAHLAVEPDTPIPGIHHLLTRALDFLDQNTVTPKAVTHFESELAKELGIIPTDEPTPHRIITRALADALPKIPKQRASLASRIDLPPLR